MINKFEEKINAFIPNQPRQKENTIGSASGVFTLKETLNDGFEKGYEVSNKITNKNLRSKAPTSNEKNYGLGDKFWCMPLPKNKNYKRFVDFQNDVTVSDIELSQIGYKKLPDDFLVVAEFDSNGVAENMDLTQKLGLVFSVRLKIHGASSENWVILSEIHLSRKFKR